MLQAKLNNGKLITPAMFPRQKVLELKSGKHVYFCPVCGERVILRAGEKVIAHFAHAKDADCPTIGGGEGAYHEQGKLRLYQWLRNQGLKVKLESYVPEIRQRPDLLVHVQDKRIAIEYQCVKIATEEIISRTTGYQQAGIHVLWILGDKLMKRRGSQMLRLDSFKKALIHQYSPEYPLSIFYFCPLTSKFIKFQDLTFINTHHAVGKLTISPLRQTNLRELLSKAYVSKGVLNSIWKREKKRFRLSRKYRVYGREKGWLNWLYEKGVYKEQLPSIVHLPILSAYLLKVPGWIWQSQIVFQVLARVRIGGIVSLSQCIKLTKDDLLSPEDFPLITSPMDPILEYLLLLCEAGILERTSETTFKKISEIQLHTELETAIQTDSLLIDTLFKNNNH